MNNDDQDVKSEDSDTDMEEFFKNNCDITVLDITILKTSHEVNQIFTILGLQFLFCLPPEAGKECLPTASSSLNVSTTTFNDSFISTEAEWYQKSKMWYKIL